MADDEDPTLLAENIGANGEEDIESEDDDDDNSEGDDMDDSSGEDNDDEESGNDDDEKTMKNMEIFIRTFHNGNYDVEFEAALSFDRGVTLPVRPTQASYNKPDNWRERNRIGLEKVREQLQSCIDWVSLINSGMFFLHLIHNSVSGQLLDNEEPIVWHEPILDEYWDQLENEIDRNCQLHIVNDISDINIVNVEMKKERMAALVEILSSRRAAYSGDSVYFNNANLCGDGIISLSKLVDACSQLQTLIIKHNRIDNMESARCLSRSLKSHSSIDEIHLNYCDIGSSPEILSVILQSEVKNIHLNNNNIDSLGAVAIAEYLESDPPIEYLSLENNHLNDDDAIILSPALKTNMNLSHLHLWTNEFSSIGVKALLTCVFDSSSLNAISESNHSLEELSLFLPAQDDWLQNCMDRLLELDRIQKILLALQDKDSLLQYLANVPVELIPEVLAFPRREYNQQHCRYLNIMYSTKLHSHSSF
jgi:hypothetical protein